MTIIAQEIIGVHERDLRGPLLPLLRGRVFHVTTAAALPSILGAGKVSWDYGEPRYPNAYFRSRGCLSVCDLRSLTEEELDDGLAKYTFVDPFTSEDPAFLFIDPQRLERPLISWREQRERRDFEKQVVPFIEAGFRGDLPVAYLESILIAKIERDPLTQALMEASRPK